MFKDVSLDYLYEIFKKKEVEASFIFLKYKDSDTPFSVKWRINVDINQIHALLEKGLKKDTKKRD